MAENKLTDRHVKSAPAGKHEDGAGLRLVVSNRLSRRWVLRYTIHGKRREMGLGPYPEVSLLMARTDALRYRRLARDGVDPIYTRRSEAERTPSFTTCAAQFILSKRSGWKNRKHARQWVSTLKTYARPILGHKPVDQINTDDVLAVLKPIWQSKTETASRVRSRIENVMDYATANQHRQGPNPAQWRGHLDKLLVSPKKISKVSHHPALPYPDLPAFYASISDNTSLSAKALRLTILTAARTSEVIEAKWPEFDLVDRVWTIPEDRMKAGKQHRVPLPDEAVKILKSIPRIDDNHHVFAGRTGKSISKMAMIQFMRKRGYGLHGENGNAVPHGFRSTFRDWVSEESTYSREVAEMALAHVIDNKVEAAYRRGDLFLTRTQMMHAWVGFASSELHRVNTCPLDRAD